MVLDSTVTKPPLLKIDLVYEEKYSECDKFEISIRKSSLGLHQKVSALCANINLDDYKKPCVNPLSLKSHHCTDESEKPYTSNEQSPLLMAVSQMLPGYFYKRENLS
jgi:hypothetical protein